MNMRRYWPNPVQPDLRSLAAFRMLAALCFIGNFSNVSIGASQIFGPPAISSIHGVWAALMISATFLLFTGYRSRFCCLLLWAGLSLPSWLAPEAMQAAFHWKILFFWSAFLPISSRYSIDRALDLDDSPQDTASEITAGTLGFTLHFAILLFSAPSPILWLWGAAWIPPQLWPLLRGFLTADKPLSIYYDRDCGFCKRMTAILKTFAAIPNQSVRPAQSLPEIAEQMQRENSWVVVDEKGRSHYRFEAFLLVLSSLKPLSPFITLLRLKPLFHWGTQAYVHVSTHRSQYSRMSAWLTWRPLEKSLTQAQNITAAAALVLLLGLLLLPNTTLIRLFGLLLGFVAY